MKWKLLIGATVFSVSAAAAQNSPPFSFQGATLGMSLDSFRMLKGGETVHMRVINEASGRKAKPTYVDVPTPVCSDAIGPTAFPAVKLQDGEIVCDVRLGDSYRQDLDINGSPVDAIEFYFFNNKLERIFIRFQPKRYASIADAFMRKYGQPDKTSSREYQNRFGARWTGALLSWHNGSQLILLNEGEDNGPGRDSSASTSYASLSDPSLEPKSNAGSALNF